MGSTLKNEVKSGRFTDVPDLVEDKLSDVVISRGLGSVKYPDDEAAAKTFSITTSEILKGLSTGRPAAKGKYNYKKKEWRSWSNKSPPNQHEEQVCEYFNRIADHVYKEHNIPKEQDGRRVFSDQFKNKAPRGAAVNCSRKPDGVVLDGATKTAAKDKVSWSDIRAILEFKESDTMKNRLEAYFQLLEYARLVFCTQMNRRFVLGATLTGNMMTFYVFDRSGVLCSESFDIMSNPEKLVRVVIGLLFADHIDLGYDPTVIINHKIKEGTSTEDKGKIIFMCKPYTIIDILYVESSVRGRGTTCFLIEYMGQLCVIKDSWVDDSRTMLEHDVLTTVSDVEGVPTIIAFEDVKVRNVKDTTATDRHALMDENHWRNDDKWKGFERAETRTHRRIMMTPYGKPLESFTSLVELLTAIKNIIKTIESLNDKNVLHRDISIRNLVLALIDPKEPKKGRRGYIIDFDYAIFYNPEESRDPAKGHRTGTLPFMALDMMVSETKNKVPHAYYHDLESVFYVLCWICTTQEGPNSASRSPISKFYESEIAKWGGYGRDNLDLELVSSLKSKDMLNPVNFEQILDQFASYFEPLRNCLRSMRKVIISTASPLPEDIEKTKETLRSWKEHNTGRDIPLDMLANIPPGHRNAKDVFGVLYTIIDATLANLVEPPAPSLKTASVPDKTRDTDEVESLTPQQIAEVKVVNIIDKEEAFRERKKAEDEEVKNERLHRNVRRSPRFTGGNGPSVASASGTLLSLFTSSSTGTKRDSAKKRKHGSKQK